MRRDERDEVKKEQREAAGILRPALLLIAAAVTLTPCWVVRAQNGNTARIVGGRPQPAGGQANSNRATQAERTGPRAGAAGQAGRTGNMPGAQTQQPKPGGPQGSRSGATTQPGQGQGQAGGALVSRPVPRLGADLSATRSTANEFKDYVKQLAASGGLSFKLSTLARSGQKVVWQVGSQPFERPRHAADWRSPAGLLKSGETAFAKPDAQFKLDLPALLGQATAKPQRIYVRALVISDGRLAAAPSNAVVVDYRSNSSADVEIPEASKPKPGVQSKVTVVTYKPPVRSGNPCRFILTKTPPAGELKVILSKIKATTPGARFQLCPSDYAYLKNNLSPGEWASIAFQDFLKVIKSGYNWLDDKYNFVENQLVEALGGVGVPPSLARKMVNTFKAAYGLSPSYGNFDEALDHGKAAFAAHLASSGDVPEKEKANIIAKVNQYVNEVKAYANGGQDPNQFYRMDPEYAARPAYVVLRVQYEAVNGAPANAVGGGRGISVRVTSGRTVDKSTLNPSFASGYQEWAPIPLAGKTVDIHNAKAGTVIDIPVYVDYSSLYKSDEYRWTQGYNSTEPGAIEAGGTKLKWVVNKKYPQ